MRRCLLALGIFFLVWSGGALLMREPTGGAEHAPASRAVEAALVELGPDVGMGLGPKDPSLVVRVFGDYECPACARLDAVAGRRLREWAQADRLRYVYHHAPLSVHRRGRAAAAAAYCAWRAGQGWEMHALLYDRRGEWSVGRAPTERFRRYADEIGIDPDEFLRCLARPETLERVEGDLRLARDLDIGGVPRVVVDGHLLAELRRPGELIDTVAAKMGNGSGR